MSDPRVPERPMLTSRDVARLAGVSQATVSRVIHGSTAVSEPTRERVERVLDRTGYKPNLMARAMRTRRTGTVGVVVTRLTNPFYPHLLEALNRTLEQAGYRMILWEASGDGERAAEDAIRQGLVDGAICTTITARSTLLRLAVEEQAPIVLVNRGVPDAPVDQVTSDNRQAARTIARYLVDGGHRRIGMICGPPEASTSTERERGFCSGLEELGLTVDPKLVYRGDFSHRDGHRGMGELLASSEPPTAVFCVNDLLALGALDRARSAGVAVPRDVWVVGYDDIEMAAWEAFDLTTIKQPLAEMALAAVELLNARLQNPGAPRQSMRFPGELIIRGSTAHAPERLHGGDDT